MSQEKLTDIPRNIIHRKKNQEMLNKRDPMKKKKKKKVVACNFVGVLL